MTAICRYGVVKGAAEAKFALIIQLQLGDCRHALNVFLHDWAVKFGAKA